MSSVKVTLDDEEDGDGTRQEEERAKVLGGV
jgi:hypothetical protein